MPPEPSAPVHQAMNHLIELLERNLVGEGADEVLALRRALRGMHGAQDESALASRFQGSRLCTVAAPSLCLGALRSELTQTPGALVDTWSTGLVTLVPGLPKNAASDPRDRVLRTIARIRRVAPKAAIGVSTVLDAVHQAPRGIDEASRALDSCQPGQAVFADDAWVHIAVSRMRSSLRDSLSVDSPLSRLDAVRSGAELRRTLTSWLQADGDVRLAAEELHLHPNTVRYRLNKAAEITGLDLEDPLQRLVAHLALTS